MDSREAFNRLLAEEAQAVNPPLDRSQSERGNGPLPGSSSGWGCSWRCSMRLIELEAAHADLRRRCMASEASEAAMSARLNASEGSETGLRAQLDTLTRLHLKTQQAAQSQLAEKEEEVIGEGAVTTPAHLLWGTAGIINH